MCGNTCHEKQAEGNNNTIKCVSLHDIKDYEHHPIRLIGLSVSNPREDTGEKGVWEQLSFEQLFAKDFVLYMHVRKYLP